MNTYEQALALCGRMLQRNVLISMYEFRGKKSWMLSINKCGANPFPNFFEMG